MLLEINSTHAKTVDIDKAPRLPGVFVNLNSPTLQQAKSFERFSSSVNYGTISCTTSFFLENIPMTICLFLYNIFICGKINSKSPA